MAAVAVRKKVSIGHFESRATRLYTPLCRSVRRSVGPSVRLSVGPSVGPSHFTFSALMGVLALLLLPKCSTDLNYGPCPPARDWGSRVSGLVYFTGTWYYKWGQRRQDCYKQTEQPGEDLSSNAPPKGHEPALMRA